MIIYSGKEKINYHFFNYLNLRKPNNARYTTLIFKELDSEKGNLKQVINALIFTRIFFKPSTLP
jgi:hypothetical protein